MATTARIGKGSVRHGLPKVLGTSSSSVNQMTYIAAICRSVVLNTQSKEASLMKAWFTRLPLHVLVPNGVQNFFQIDSW